MGTVKVLSISGRGQESLKGFEAALHGRQLEVEDSRRALSHSPNGRIKKTQGQKQTARCGFVS